MPGPPRQSSRQDGTAAERSSRNPRRFDSSAGEGTSDLLLNALSAALLSLLLAAAAAVLVHQKNLFTDPVDVVGAPLLSGYSERSEQVALLVFWAVTVVAPLPLLLLVRQLPMRVRRLFGGLAVLVLPLAVFSFQPGAHNLLIAATAGVGAVFIGALSFTKWASLRMQCLVLPRSAEFVPIRTTVTGFGRGRFHDGQILSAVCEFETGKTLYTQVFPLRSFQFFISWLGRHLLPRTVEGYFLVGQLLAFLPLVGGSLLGFAWTRSLRWGLATALVLATVLRFLGEHQRLLRASPDVRNAARQSIDRGDVGLFGNLERLHGMRLEDPHSFSSSTVGFPVNIHADGHPFVERA
ncbi:MAG: hypothetical protein CMJ48_00415 [Planctomycetaceae bacterium]|nr:hypothetical protein [Planctomycetaceae bacterium]